MHERCRAVDGYSPPRCIAAQLKNPTRIHSHERRTRNVSDAAFSASGQEGRLSIECKKDGPCLAS
jgi:hypothetical protein